MIRKSIFIVLLFVSVCLSAANKPNVIVVLADDVGTGDISFYRNMHSDNIILETPNIDKLASTGMVFTNAHSPAALCAPSRYAIMTGNSCYRSYAPWGVWGSYEKSPINKNQLTLGKLMQQAGYNTAFLGKWHLGGDYYKKNDSTTIYRGPRWKPELDVDITKIVGGGPQQNGFTYSFTYPAGIQDVPYAVYENGNWMPLADDSEIGFISQEKMNKINVKLDKMEGLGDSNWDPHQMGPLLVQKAVNYINTAANADKPFFMYYSTQAVHLPHTPPAELNGIKIAGTTPSKHMDMIKELDVQIAMLIQALKDKGIYDNTLIIFTSDNGGLQRNETLKSGHKPNDIYRGGKNTAFEGGHRVPFIVSWPQHINEKQLSPVPILGLDILATLAAVTNQKIEPNQAQDSYNILPVLKQTKNAPEHPFLMLQGGTGNELVIIENNWKLIMKEHKKEEGNSPIALFNLSDNPQEKEQYNLLTNPLYKDKVDYLHRTYNKARLSKENTGSKN